MPADTSTVPPAQTSANESPSASRWVRQRPAVAIFACFLVVGLLLLLCCPPLWRDYDGLIQISSRPSDMTILQYPAAYPFFSRLHVYAAAILEGRIHHHKVTIDIAKGVVLNDVGVHALMISQELLLALALTAFVLSAARSLAARWWIVLLLASNASLFIVADLVSTEALASVLMIALAAAGLWLFRAEKISVAGMIAYALCLYVAIMTRHTNAIFAMLVPTAYLLRFVVEWIRARRAALAPWKAAAVFVLVGLLCIGASKLTTRGLCRVFGVEYRSISARATSERLGFVQRMPEAEREVFLAGLVQRSDDPVVREAIPLLARSATWVQQRDEIEKILRRQTPELGEQELKVKADAYLETIANLYYRSGYRDLLQGTWESIWRTFAHAGPADPTRYFLETGVWSVDLYASQPSLSKKTHGLQVCSLQAKQRIVGFEKNLWLGLWRWLPYGAIYLVGTWGALFFLVRGVGDPSGPIFALAAMLTGLTATALTFFLTTYNPRFTIFADIFGWLALAILVAHWCDSRKSLRAGSMKGE